MYRVFILILVLVTPLLATFGNASAQQISLSHAAQRLMPLPQVGEPLNLYVLLKGTKKTDLRLRALIIRDGKLIDITSSNARFNEQDDPYYTFKVPAPVGRLNYYFVLTGPDGRTIATPRYSLSRDCIPPFMPGTGTVDTQVEGTKRLEELQKQALLLEKETALYSRINQLLQEVRQTTQAMKKQ